MALAYADQAVALARRVGDPAALAYALEGHVLAAWAPWNCEELVREATEVIAIAEAMGDRERAFGALDHFVPGQWQLGNIDAVRSGLARMEQLADELRQPAQRWMLTLSQAIMATAEGRLDDAERAHRPRPRARTRNPDVECDRLARAPARRAAACAGPCGGVRADAGAGRPRLPGLCHARCALAAVHVEGGSPQRAQEILSAFAAGGFILTQDEMWLLAMSFLAEAASGSRRSGRRGNDSTTCWRRTSQHVAMGPPDGCNGAIASHLGLLAIALGRTEDAERHLRRGIEIDERMGAALFVAAGKRALEDLRGAAALPRHGRREGWSHVARSAPAFRW